MTLWAAGAGVDIRVAGAQVRLQHLMFSRVPGPSMTRKVLVPAGTEHVAVDAVRCCYRSVGDTFVVAIRTADRC